MSRLLDANKIKNEANDEISLRPATLKEYGIGEKEFVAKVDTLADLAFGDQCTTANPRLPLVEELRQILIDSYYGNEV